MLRLWKGGGIDPKMSFMPSKEQCEPKDLCRYREELSKKIGDETRHIRSQMIRNGQPIPGSGNFQVMKVRGELITTYSGDTTLMYPMNDLEGLFTERDRVQKEVESRLPGCRHTFFAARPPIKITESSDDQARKVILRIIPSAVNRVRFGIIGRSRCGDPSV